MQGEIRPIETEASRVCRSGALAAIRRCISVETLNRAEGGAPTEPRNVISDLQPFTVSSLRVPRLDRSQGQ
jgi:hypothetical protein